MELERRSELRRWKEIGRKRELGRSREQDWWREKGLRLEGPGLQRELGRWSKIERRIGSQGGRWSVE